jgi:RimJ/RimL family protein N-acetyltransferase
MGRGLCTETTAALTRVAFELCGVDRVEIRVDPENGASLAIPRKLGYVEEATLRRRLPPHGNGAPRDVTLFALFRDGFKKSPAASSPLRAYDALGERVL